MPRTTGVKYRTNATAPLTRRGGGVFRMSSFEFDRPERRGRGVFMSMISPDEMSVLKTRLENLRRAKVDVQDRITKAAAMGDLSENAEYKFAKEENR
ncbi:MAG TPA: hypothetical protein PK402_03465, partial [Tepidisphaeraceae bacterium]|nr:hypothetical protein [Tepidisphaeraceae bacterium]